MCGSHIDTVRTGGRYDGNLGVLAGLEVIETLQTAGITPDRPLAVAFFTNEEGARFSPDMMGSLVYVGGMALEEALAITGIDGATVGDELHAWIEQNVSFPNSMVDRITPATIDDDREWLTTEHGVVDQWPVVTEPFLQWVVEDDFAGDRLPLEDIDVIITDNVEPYEHMKLRLLNAGHSCLAYLAALDGIETVDEALAAPHIRNYLEHFLRVEAQPLVVEVPGIDLDAYVESLIERFSNPNIGDQISRLCLDGSAKFPKFLVPTIEAAIEADAPIDASALALAGWCHYLSGTDERGRSITLANDPNLADAKNHADKAVNDPLAFLEFDVVFPAALAQNTRFQRAFVEALEMLQQSGVRSAISKVIRSS